MYVQFNAIFLCFCFFCRSIPYKIFHSPSPQIDFYERNEKWEKYVTVINEHSTFNRFLFFVVSEWIFMMIPISSFVVLEIPCLEMRKNNSTPESIIYIFVFDFSAWFDSWFYGLLRWKYKLSVNLNRIRYEKWDEGYFNEFWFIL